jgi:thiosulfate/3-mercaptopyruvate sulfurtransferase
MLPSPEKFAARMRKLGIGDGSRVVVYDSNNLMGSARVWWTFRVFGHKDTAILDGGLAKWLAEGRPVNDDPPPPRERHFTARFDHSLVRDKEQLLLNLESGREQVLDARSAGRFHAREPEIWPGRRGGHIPGSLNLPFLELIDPTAKTLLAADQLLAKFRAAEIDFGKPVVTSCGSGITAAVLAFALHLTGHRDVAVYDGSWAEWGLPGETPVEP